MIISERQVRADRVRAWVAFVLVTEVLGCAERTGSRPSTANVASARAATVRIAVPPPAVDCTNTFRAPFLTWEQAADGSFRAVTTLPGFWSAQKRRPLAAPLPFTCRPEDTAVLGAPRTIISVDGGWLIAIDRGEGEGGGLYFAKANATGIQRLDDVLALPVQWVTSTRFGIVGIAGLCHGDVCSSRTTVYRVDRVNEAAPWQLYPLALVQGCPAATATEAGGSAVLVAAACGALYRVTENGAARIATWPRHLHPYEVWGGRLGGEDIYYVSFGSVAARFTRTTAEWYAPRDCASLERGPDNLCQCSSNASLSSGGE